MEAKQSRCHSHHMKFENTRSFALQLDAEDPLAAYRERLIIPAQNGEEQVYFLGNSLGLQPKSTANHITQVMEQWDQLGVVGVFKGAAPWMEYHQRMARPLASIVGAKPEEVIV